MGTWKVLGKCVESSGVSASQSAWVWALQSCGGMWACKVRVKCVESAWKVCGKFEGMGVESARKVGGWVRWYYRDR